MTEPIGVQFAQAILEGAEPSRAEVEALALAYLAVRAALDAHREAGDALAEVVERIYVSEPWVNCDEGKGPLQPLENLEAWRKLGMRAQREEGQG